MAPPWELLALAVWLLITLAWRPLLLPDEGRYAGVAWEMLQGNGWTPTLGGLPFFHKPPLVYWIDLLAMRVFGPHEWVVRLGPAVGAWAMGAALWWAMRRWHGERAARLGLALLATTPLFYVGGQYVNHDMLVAGCITVAVLAWAVASEVPGAAARRLWRVGWAAAALGFLAKGLIGFVLPLLVVLPWLAARRQWGALRALADLPGLALAALVALPWPLAMEHAHPGFFDYFIVGQHFRRYATTGFNNVMPFWFFAAVVPLLTLPWSLWAWPALRRVAPRDAHTALWAWWAAVVLLFFSLPASKIVGYALPALPGWVALLALAVLPGRRWRAVLPLAAAVCVGAVGLLAWKSPGSNRDIGLALLHGRAPAERVVFVDDYPYDVVFYARLTAPPVVATTWDADEIRRNDSWKRELHEAGAFDPRAARERLWPLDRLAQLPCSPHATWYVALPHDDVAARVPGAAPVQAGRHATLWRAPGGACP